MTRSPDSGGVVRLRRLPTAALTPAEIAAIRAMMVAAFGEADEERFTEDDWQHALGGTHVLLDLDGTIVAHASVVEREIQVGGRPHRTGYVEAVATAPGRQGRGYGTTVMEEIDRLIRTGFELGLLGTGRHAFYERLGWRRWHGPSGVRTDDGVRWTPDDDGYLLVLDTPTTPALDLDASITCERRPGDVW